MDTVFWKYYQLKIYSSVPNLKDIKNWLYHQNVDDVLTLEGNIETDGVNYFVTLQRAINSGLWQLQGSTGLTMIAAINGSYWMLGVITSMTAQRKA